MSQFAAAGRISGSFALSGGFVPVDLHIAGGAAGSDNVRLLVAVEVTDDQVFAVHPGVVDHLLRLQLALGIDEVDGDAERLPPPADSQLLVAVAVEIGPAERVAFGQRRLDLVLGPGRRDGLLGVDHHAGTVPWIDSRQQPAAADAYELDLAR